MNRGGRRPLEEWASAHERARVRISERLTEPLDPAEGTWLEAHLLDCPACREIDAAYRRDRDLLRTLRVVPPPRDLWARTSGAIEEESARTRGLRRRPIFVRRPDWRPFGAIGTVAAVIVVGFVVGTAIVGPGRVPGVALGSAGPTAGGSIPLVATPIPVPSNQVQWAVRNGGDGGSFTIRKAPVGQVCPSDAAGCAPIDPNATNVATIAVTPRSIHESTTSGQMVVFGQAKGSLGVSMFVVSFAPTPTPSPSPVPSGSPTITIAPSVSPSTPPSTKPTESPAKSPGETSAPPSSAPPPTSSPATSPAPSPTASIVPGITPVPTAASVLAVASDLTVIGTSTAAFSPDGGWFAFTARAAADAQGSDIYLWQVRTPKAVAVTTDHRSMFAGWVNDRLVGSRANVPSDSPAPAEVGATSFIVDPATLETTDLAVPAWRPSVDPSGRWAVYWDGTIALDPTTGMWRSATGRLVIAAWPSMVAPVPEPSPSAEVRSASPSADASSSPEPSASVPASPSGSTSKASGSPSPAASATAEPSPSAVRPDLVPLPTDMADPSGVDWQVEWDELGAHVAIWIGDRADPSFGHLDLIAIDSTTGTPDATDRLRDQPALPGFALSGGQLVWATPPGQDSSGSHLEIYNYSGPEAGKTSSQAATGSDVVIVVQH